MDPKIQILWLSDIHYKHQYAEPHHKDLEKFRSSFLDYLDTLEPEEIDYLLLSGDIAQQGSAEDYEQFKKDLLIPIQKKLPRARLLVIPGNHDVSRPDAVFKAAFIQNLDVNSKRLDFFGSDVAQFEKLFKPYSDAFAANKHLSEYSSVTYKKSLLYGYVHDIRKKVIFVMLNTSWYSIGEDFLKLYLEDFLIGYQNEVNTQDSTGDKDEIRRKEVKKLTKDISCIADEYGKQLVGLEKLQGIDEILQLIEDYSDHIIVTVMHHPLNWLDWGERVTSTDKFHEIRNSTDLLLTGHEHVPMAHSSELIRDIRHIPAGCFMYASERDLPWKASKSDPLSGNWFSTLSINIKKRTLKQVKHYYSPSSHKTPWKSTISGPAINLDKKHTSELSSRRRKTISTALSGEEKTEKTVKKIFEKSEKYNDNSYLDPDKLIIFNQSEEINFDIADLKGIIKKTNRSVISFIFIDLFCSASVLYQKSRYVKAETGSPGFENILAALRKHGIDLDAVNDNEAAMERLDVLQHIKNGFDYRFDKFRYDFFSGLTAQEALEYQDLKFTSMIIPYWELESYI